MTGNELRRKFLQFFQSRDHLVLPSYSLIPKNDPTLLLIGAGMAPLKPFFTGKMKPPSPRVTTSQRCVRTGDIENVGRTARHHTFFEMLGNFSFGDYFKQDAIPWAWEFLTEQMHLPKEKLWITIHTEDDEAFKIWHQKVGIPESRIVRMKENFWEIGPGPCGPCSEIHIDLGADRGCGKSTCGVGCDCDRYLEIWNLVFTQFDRDEAGNYTPLVKKNIDTGMGLERLASILQGKPSNFETDLLFPIIERTAQIAGVPYGESKKTDIALKVIGDHARSVTALISDGILPSNEGRGYVLRRVLRRAVRYGKLLGIDRAFLPELVDVTATIFADAYPEIGAQSGFIKNVVKLEEARFQSTLDQGMEILQHHMKRLEKDQQQVLDGKTAFKLYDTFGFPRELTEEILAEDGMKLDRTAFDAAMNEQRERARTARQESAKRVVVPDLSGLVKDVKYDETATKGHIAVLLRDGKVVATAQDGQDVALVLDVTPFYAESGGQCGDHGVISSTGARLDVYDVKKQPDGTIYHLAHVTEGVVSSGDEMTLAVDWERRQDTARNHTATHLLQRALKQVLGEHVHQAGSEVTPERLRFDFSHFAALSAEEMQKVEDIVNQVVLADLPVTITHTTLEAAKEMGAMALFGEKYRPEDVRMVSMGDFSRELCGGTHLTGTAQVGLFKILSESNIGAGVRRIEAVTGHAALAYVREAEDLLKRTADTLKVRRDDIPAKTENLLTQIKMLSHELEEAQGQLARSAVNDLLENVREVNGVRLVTGIVKAADMQDLRRVADLTRDKLVSGVLVLGAVQDAKVQLVAMVTQDWVKRKLHAGNLIREVAKLVGGNGGGRPDMAQAGGKEPAKLTEALDAVVELIRAQMEGKR